MASRKQAIEKYNAGKIRSALNIAKNFKIGVTAEERNIMAMGYECEVHPEFYTQIGTDIEKTKADALAVLKKVLGIVDETESEEDKETWLLLMRHKETGKKSMFIIRTDDVQEEIKKLRGTGYTFILCLSVFKAKRFLSGNSYGMKGVLKNYEDAGIETDPKALFKTYVEFAEEGLVEFQKEIAA